MADASHALSLNAVDRSGRQIETRRWLNTASLLLLTVGQSVSALWRVTLLLTLLSSFLRVLTTRVNDTVGKPPKNKQLVSRKRDESYLATGSTLLSHTISRRVSTSATHPTLYNH